MDNVADLKKFRADWSKLRHHLNYTIRLIVWTGLEEIAINLPVVEPWAKLGIRYHWPSTMWILPLQIVSTVWNFRIIYLAWIEYPPKECLKLGISNGFLILIFYWKMAQFAFLFINYFRTYRSITFIKQL